MNKYSFLCAAVFFFCVISGPVHSFADPSNNPEEAQITKVVAGLKKADKKFDLLRAKINKTNKRLRTDIMSQVTRSSLKNQVEIYQGQMRAYKNDGMNDVSYLRNHRENLTQSQMDLVKQAHFDLTQ